MSHSNKIPECKYWEFGAVTMCAIRRAPCTHGYCVETYDPNRTHRSKVDEERKTPYRERPVAPYPVELLERLG